LLLIPMVTCAQTTFKAEDINGKWQSSKPGAELFIEIENSKATITSVGKTTLTKKLEGGNMYESIHFIEGGKWKAQRNAWIYNGVGGQNAENGRWEKAKENELTLSLSADGNVLTASGHWSYKRVEPKIFSVDEPKGQDTKETVIENFGGVSATFYLISNQGGGSFIVAKFSNKTIYKASINVKNQDGSFYKEELDSGSTLTKKYDTQTMEVEVDYQKGNKKNTGTDIIESIKQHVRKKVTNENGKIKVIDAAGSPGVRG
jgi:hypothetical protein